MNFPGSPQAPPLPPPLDLSLLRSEMTRGAATASVSHAAAPGFSSSSLVVGGGDLASSLALSAASFSLITSSQNARRAFHDLSLPRMASNNAGSEKSSPTTAARTWRCAAHAGHSSKVLLRAPPGELSIRANSLYIPRCHGE